MENLLFSGVPILKHIRVNGKELSDKKKQKKHKQGPLVQNGVVESRSTYNKVC